jgi:hypothetical protein
MIIIIENIKTKAAIAPQKSNLPGFSLKIGITLNPMIKAMTPMGMLIRNVKRQPNRLVKKPPNDGPMAKPAEILIAKIPKALPNSLAGKLEVIMAKGTAIIIPAVNPCTARKMISQYMLGASPHKPEEITNPPSP